MKLTAVAWVIGALPVFAQIDTARTTYDYSEYYGYYYSIDLVSSVLYNQSIKSAEGLIYWVHLYEGQNDLVFAYSGGHDVGGYTVGPKSPAEFLLTDHRGEIRPNQSVRLGEGNNNKLSWIIPGKKKVDFVRLNSLDEFLNLWLLNQTHLAEDGSQYVFNNGRAIWPDREFGYKIKVDLYLIGLDCFEVLSDTSSDYVNTHLGFTRKGDSLYVYEMKYAFPAEEIGLVPRSSPLLALSESKEQPYHKSTRYQDLENRLPSELRLLRNEVFARHGQSFKSSKLRSYFNRFSWYKERNGYLVKEDELLSDELNLVSRIIKLEKSFP